MTQETLLLSTDPFLGDVAHTNNFYSYDRNSWTFLIMISENC